MRLTSVRKALHRGTLRLALLIALGASALALLLPIGSGAVASGVGSVNAFCSYDGATWRIIWKGSAAGWTRRDLHWDIKLISPFGTTVGHHYSTWYNSTGGTTPTYYYPSALAPYRTHLVVNSVPDDDTC